MTKNNITVGVRSLKKKASTTMYCLKANVNVVSAQPHFDSTVNYNYL